MRWSPGQLLKVDWQQSTGFGLTREANSSFLGSSVARHFSSDYNCSGLKRGSFWRLALNPANSPNGHVLCYSALFED